MTTALLKNKFQSLLTKKSQIEEQSNRLSVERKIGLMAKLFGCRHGELGRPFAKGDAAYRTCLKCGARKRFNPQTLETFGKFYYPSVIDNSFTDKS